MCLVCSPCLPEAQRQWGNRDCDATPPSPIPTENNYFANTLVFLFYTSFMMILFSLPPPVSPFFSPVTVLPYTSPSFNYHSSVLPFDCSSFGPLHHPSFPDWVPSLFSEMVMVSPYSWFSFLYFSALTLGFLLSQQFCFLFISQFCFTVSFCSFWLFIYLFISPCCPVLFSAVRIHGFPVPQLLLPLPFRCHIYAVPWR